MVKKLIILLLLTLLLGVATVQAQDSRNQLLIAYQGDFWSWSGSSLTQLTTWGYNEAPVMSPDGRYIAYNSWAQLVVDEINKTGQNYFMGAPPSNIWVLDLADNSAQRVADQPPNATLFSENSQGNHILRGDPAWSPDGSALAWVELVIPTGNLQLVRYNFSDGSRQILVPQLPFPFMDGGYFVPSIKWGVSGIAYEHATFVDNANGFHQFIYVYDANSGSVISQTLIHQEGILNSYVINYYWAEYGGQNVLAMLFNGKPSIGIIDPIGGTVQEINGQIQAYSAGNSNNVRLVNIQNADASQIAWIFQSANGATTQVSDSWRTYGQRFALAGNGSAAAYVTEAVYTWQDGQSQLIPGTATDPQAYAQFPTEVVWSSMKYRVVADVISAASPPNIGSGGNTSDNTGCTLPPRLNVGATAVVLPGEPNVIREQPRTGADNPTLGQIPAGGNFKVLNGPSCGSGFYWWYVDYNGTLGWTAEGDGGINTYWLQAQSCYNSPAPRLTVGMQAQVIPNTTPNALRAAPRGQLNDQVIGNIPAGEPFTIIGNFACGDLGRVWWQVNYKGTVGWTAEGEGNTYWIEPVN